MTTECELMAAIRRAPDDDGPRLAYAAWIEGADPARAGLIRSQCGAQRGSSATGEPSTEETLLRRHGARWLADAGLAQDEGVLVRGFVERVVLAVPRALELLPRLLDAPLRSATVSVDLSGDEDELAALASGLRDHPTLRAWRIDRRHHWDHHQRDDSVALDDAGAALNVELGEGSGPRASLEVLRGLVERQPQVRSISVDLSARGRVEGDDVLDLLIAATSLAELQTIELAFVDGSGRDWMRWLILSRLAELLAAHPRIERLSLPMAELRIDEPLDHPTLRDLELQWFGMTPGGPADPDKVGRGGRGAGLDFLRSAALPALERLAVDYQYGWYIPWEPRDLLAPIEAPLPRLRELVLRYADPGDGICERLASAPSAALLERIELTGSTLSERGLAALVRDRSRFPALRELVLGRPLDVSDAAWEELLAAYPVDDRDR